MSSIALSSDDISALRERHAGVLHKPLLKRLIAPVAVAVTGAYLVFCFFFFNVAGVIGEAQWERASAYVADWYSWEAQPRFRFKDGASRSSGRARCWATIRTPSGSRSAGHPTTS